MYWNIIDLDFCSIYMIAIGHTNVYSQVIHCMCKLAARYSVVLYHKYVSRNEIY